MSSSSSKHWSDAVHHQPVSRPKDLEIFSFKSGHVQQYLSTFPGPSRTGTFTHPLTSRAPLTIPLTVQVPGGGSGTTFNSSHHSPFMVQAGTGYVPVSPGFPAQPRYLPTTAATYSETISGVSLSLIQSDHDVINSSSVIQKATSSSTTSSASAPNNSQFHQPHQSSQSSCKSTDIREASSCTCGCLSASGPLTRSRKRRLKEGEVSEYAGPLDLKVDRKTKMKRTGTIVIE